MLENELHCKLFKTIIEKLVLCIAAIAEGILKRDGRSMFYFTTKQIDFADSLSGMDVQCLPLLLMLLRGLKIDDVNMTKSCIVFRDLFPPTGLHSTKSSRIISGKERDRWSCRQWSIKHKGANR